MVFSALKKNTQQPTAECFLGFPSKKQVFSRGSKHHEQTKGESPPSWNNRPYQGDFQSFAKPSILDGSHHFFSPPLNPENFHVGSVNFIMMKQPKKFDVWDLFANYFCPTSKQLNESRDDWWPLFIGWVSFLGCSSKGFGISQWIYPYR